MNTDAGDQLIDPEPKRDSEDPSQVSLFGIRFEVNDDIPVGEIHVRSIVDGEPQVTKIVNVTPHDREVKPRTSDEVTGLHRGDDTTTIVP